MLILLLIYFVTVFAGAKLNIKGNIDYLSIENTQAIKGIFILMVFYSHFNSYITLSGRFDEIYIKLFHTVGQAMVSMFLFYSGFGIMESIKRKGNMYIETIPKRRIFRTLINFDFAVLIYLALTLLLGSTPTISQTILSLIGIESLGNSNWYIFVILVLYLLTFTVFKLFSKMPNYISVFALGISVCVLILITHRFSLKPTYWYDTALCYVFGAAYSLSRKYIEKILNKNIFIYITATFLSVTLYFVLINRRLFFSMAANLVFAAAIILITMRVTLKNRILVWCGDHLFEIYILQRIPMIIFKKLGVNSVNTYLYFALCVAVTFGLSIVFRFATNKFWNKTAK